MKTFTKTLKWGQLLLLAGVVSFSITSCNTDDTDPPANPSNNPPTPTIEDGHGTLVAIKTVTFQDVPGFGQMEIDLGLAVGVFFNGVDYETYLNAGTVTCEGENLAEQSNGSYLFIPSQTNPTGIEYSGNPDWVVGGNTNIPGFSHTTNIGFPSVGTISSSSTVNSANSFTLTVANVSGADSVIFSVGGVMHTVAGNVTSSVFTAAEIGTIGKGANYAQVAAYRVEQSTYGGKNFWFVNEKVVTQSITVE